MERFLLYLDDLDDLYGMIALMGERFRNLCILSFLIVVMAVVVVLASCLAFFHPPIALATSVLLFVTLGYRFVTQKPADEQIIPT